MTSLAVAPSRALTTSLDGSARLWDVVKNECLVCYVGHESAVLDGDIDAEGRTVVTGSADGTARLWPCDLLDAVARFEPESLRKLIGTIPLPEPTERSVVNEGK